MAQFLLALLVMAWRPRSRFVPSLPSLPFPFLLLALLLWPAPSAAYEAGTPPREATQTAQRLREVEAQGKELLRRLKRLERGQLRDAPAADVRGSSAVPPAAIARPATPPDLPAEEIGAAETQPGDVGLGITARYGSVRATFQSFGDVGFEFRNPSEPETGQTTFALGALDLFASAQIGDRFHAVAEVAFEGEGERNRIGVHLERVWGAWTFRDALKVKLGREHLPTSRWNRLFHHGRWLWVSATQPFLARFEDDGGTLPVHFLGLEANGRVQTGGGVLEYVGVVANGRGREPEEVANFSDRNGAKAFALGLGYTPRALSRLSIGGNFYADRIPSVPEDGDRRRSMREIIGSAYLQYSGQHLDMLGEFAWIAHADRTAGRTFHHRLGYMQLSYRIGMLTPYARFDYRGMRRGDPFYTPSDIDLDEWEQIIGVRYDLTDLVALKLEGGGGSGERRNGAGQVRQRGLGRLAVQLTWVF